MSKKMSKTKGPQPCSMPSRILRKTRAGGILYFSQEWNADDILAAAPLYSDRITNLTTQIAGMKTIGDAMLADYSQSVVALGAAQELSRQNHEAALGFQERAMNAERERGELQAELAAAQGPCKICQEKSEEIRDALRPAGNGLYLMDPVGAIKLAVKWLVGYHEQLAAIRGQGAHAFRIDESQRQATLLALGHLAVERPGWDFMLSEIALRMDNTVEGRPELFDKFRQMHAEEMAVRKPRE